MFKPFDESVIKSFEEDISLCQAYYKAKELDSEFFDFEEIIWVKDVEHICNVFINNDIKFFTISSTQADMPSLLALFAKYGGYYPCDLENVRSKYHKINIHTAEPIDGVYEEIPAIVMKRGI